MSTWRPSRRLFLKTSIAGLGTLYLQGCSSLFRPREGHESDGLGSSDFLARFGPIDRSLGDTMEAAFSGDNFDRPHRILWSKADYLASRPLPTSAETTDLVILGGGISGLTTAYLHRQRKPILLEQAARLGGNAKGQSWRGIDYGLGSAYIDKPTPGTPMARFFDEMALSTLMVERKNPDPVEWNGKVHTDFRSGSTEPKYRDKYDRLGKFFTLLHQAKKRGYPEVPCLTKAHRDSANYWDRYTLHGLLDRELGGLPPHLETLIEHYCWSTYAASARELSAASALSFLANDASTICAAPGGNAAIAERVATQLLASLPAANVRCGALAVDVRVDDSGVDVLYENAAGELKKIRAKAAVFAGPKFVAKRIVQDLEPARLQAINRVKYRAYLVANVLLRGQSQQQFYDLFLTGDGKTKFTDLSQEATAQGATDVILGNFAKPDPDHTVLTLYRALPYDTGRAELFAPTSYRTFREQFETQIRRSILPLLGLKENQVVDLRLTRWGHALPVAPVGTFKDGWVDQLRAPFRKRLFFVQQDNWLQPALKTGITEAYLWQDAINAVL